MRLTRAATRISRPIFSKDLVNSPTTSSPTYKQLKQNQYKSNCQKPAQVKSIREMKRKLVGILHLKRVCMINLGTIKDQHSNPDSKNYNATAVVYTLTEKNTHACIWIMHHSHAQNKWDDNKKEWQGKKDRTEYNKIKVTRITASSILKPLVHFIRVPDEIDVCLTGNEKVKPSSLCLPGAGWNSSGSELTNFASFSAIKSNNSCNSIINILQRVVKAHYCDRISNKETYMWATSHQMRRNGNFFRL